MSTVTDTYGNSIDIKINRRQTRALIDTGSYFTYINANFADKIGLEIIPPSLDTPTYMLGANGTHLDILGCATAEINITGYTQAVDFVVINNLFHNVILGIDTLRQLRAAIDVHTGTLSIADDWITVPLIRRFPIRNILRTISSVTIPSQDESHILLRAARNYVLQPSIIEPI